MFLKVDNDMGGRYYAELIKVRDQIACMLGGTVYTMYIYTITLHTVCVCMHVPVC